MAKGEQRSNKEKKKPKQEKPKGSDSKAAPLLGKGMATAGKSKG